MSEYSPNPSFQGRSTNGVAALLTQSSNAAALAKQATQIYEEASLVKTKLLEQLTDTFEQHGLIGQLDFLQRQTHSLLDSLSEAMRLIPTFALERGLPLSIEISDVCKKFAQKHDAQVSNNVPRLFQTSSYLARGDRHVVANIASRIAIASSMLRANCICMQLFIEMVVRELPAPLVA